MDVTVVVEGAFDGEDALIGIDVSFWIVYNVVCQTYPYRDLQRISSRKGIGII